MAHLITVASSRVVHEDIDSAPELHCLFNGGLPVLGLGHVHGLKAEGLRGRSHLLAGLRVEVADQDFGTLLSEVLGDALSKATGSAFQGQVSAFNYGEKRSSTYR